MPFNCCWAKSNSVKGRVASSGEVRKIVSIEVIDQAAFCREESTEAVGLVLAGNVLSSIGITNHRYAALTAVPASCFQGGPPLFISHGPLLKAVSNAIHFAMPGFAKADSTLLLEVFRPYLDFWSEIKKSVTTYFALGYVEAVYQVSARLTKL